VVVVVVALLLLLLLSDCNLLQQAADAHSTLQVHEVGGAGRGRSWKKGLCPRLSRPNAMMTAAKALVTLHGRLLYHFCFDSETLSHAAMDAFTAALSKLKAAKAPAAYGGSRFAADPSSSTSSPPVKVTQEDHQRKRLLDAAAAIRADREAVGRPSRRGKGGKRVLAVMLVIIDALPHEALWREWMQSCSDDSFADRDRVEVRFWIHAKYPSQVQSEWVKERLLPNSHRPKWGSIEITLAMIDLAKAAIADPEVGRLLYASETCIPLAPLQEAAFELWRTEQSWVNYSMTPTNGYDTIQKWGKMSMAVPKERISKADQWCCLTRTHVEDVLRLPEQAHERLWRLMESVTASDEMYIATALCILRELKVLGDSGERVAKRRVTWCDWSTSAKNPTAYSSFDPSSTVLQQAVAQGCLFARKWAAGAVDIAAWQSWQAARLQAFTERLDTMDSTEKAAAFQQIYDNGQEPPEGSYSSASEAADSGSNALQLSGALSASREGQQQQQQQHRQQQQQQRYRSDSRDRRQHSGSGYYGNTNSRKRDRSRSGNDNDFHHMHSSNQQQQPSRFESSRNTLALDTVAITAAATIGGASAGKIGTWVTKDDVIAAKTTDNSSNSTANTKAVLPFNNTLALPAVSTELRKRQSSSSNNSDTVHRGSVGSHKAARRGDNRGRGNGSNSNGSNGNGSNSNSIDYSSYARPADRQQQTD
jgi:Core-2/I-Branching enzyme